MVEAFRRAVRDRAVGPERRVAFVTRLDQPLLRRGRSGSCPAGRRTKRRAGLRPSPTSGRRPRKSFCRCARRDVCISIEDRRLDLFRKRRFEHQLPGFAADAGEFVEVVDVEPLSSFCSLLRRPSVSSSRLRKRGSSSKIRRPPARPASSVRGTVRRGWRICRRRARHRRCRPG